MEGVGGRRWSEGGVRIGDGRRCGAERQRAIGMEETCGTTREQAGQLMVLTNMAVHIVLSR